jgi:putative transposase
MGSVSESEIEHFVMAITSAEAIVPHPAPAEMDEQGEQPAMAKKKRHSRAEIATKLAQANDLAIRGRLQSEIARTLGVSVMTLHRWRKASHGPEPADGLGKPNGTRGRGARIAELQLENSRLRRLVTDLLLEKIRLEEAAQSQSSIA